MRTESNQIVDCLHVRHTDLIPKISYFRFVAPFISVICIQVEHRDKTQKQLGSSFPGMANCWLLELDRWKTERRMR